MAFFANGALNTRYEITGEGPPVVLIHGVGSRLDNWAEVVARLRVHFRVLSYDLRGSGQSTRMPGPYSLDLYSADLLELIDHLGFKRCHLAGHSLGGMIAQRFAIDHGERVDRLALLSAVAGRTAEERERVAERVDLIRSGIPGGHFQRSLSRWFTDEFIKSNPERIAAYAETNAENDPQCYAAAYRVLAFEDLDEELSRITAPTLIATGENDQGSNPRMSELMHKRIKHSTLRILPVLKHSLLIEAPAVVATMLDLFFRGQAMPPAEEIIARPWR